VAIATVIYGGRSLGWAIASLWVGTLVGVGFGTRLIPLEPPQWRPPAALILPATIVGLSTSQLPRLAAVLLAFLLGAAIGWLAAWRSSRASAPYRRRDLVAPALAAVIILASAVLTSAPFASLLVLAALALWVLGIVFVLILAPLSRLTKLRWNAMPPVHNAAHAYRWFLVGAACAVVAFIIGSHDLSRVDGPLRDRIDQIAEHDHGTPKATVAALESAQELRDSMMIRAYSPRLFLPDAGAAWPHHPLVDVLESEVVDEQGHHSTTEFRPPNEPSVPAGCRYPAGRSCYLTDHCFHAGAACGEVATRPEAWPYGKYVPAGGDTRSNYLRPYGAIYARIVHRDGESPGDREADVDKLWKHVGLAEQHFDGRRITDLLQYWMYYRYDDWRANTSLGQLVQEHESDWEAVTVAVADSEPLLVAYSAHCGGQWLPWEKVPAVRNRPPDTFILESLARQHPEQAANVREVIDAGNAEPTHPAVMVAAGSQGNYPASSDIRVPDWSSCKLEHTWGDVFAAAAAVREHVDVAVEVVPADIYLAGIQWLPMQFGGHWGLNSQTRLLLPFAGELTVDGGPKGPGPPAPPQQTMWSDPFKRIFASDVWHEGG